MGGRRHLGGAALFFTSFRRRLLRASLSSTRRLRTIDKGKACGRDAANRISRLVQLFINQLKTYDYDKDISNLEKRNMGRWR